MDVLIVDDSAAIRKILQRVLAQTNLSLGKVFEAGDGQEALNTLQANRVDLVLSDINMPIMDGLQFLAALKAKSEYASVPVVMITTEGSQAKVMEAVNLGASGYVKKPFTADHIQEKLRAVLPR